MGTAVTPGKVTVSLPVLCLFSLQEARKDLGKASSCRARRALLNGMPFLPSTARFRAPLVLQAEPAGPYRALTAAGVALDISLVGIAERKVSLDALHERGVLMRAHRLIR